MTPGGFYFYFYPLLFKELSISKRMWSLCIVLLTKYDQVVTINVIILIGFHCPILLFKALMSTVLISTRLQNGPSSDLYLVTKAMRSGKSFKLWYMYRENPYILTGTFQYIFSIGIGFKNLLVSEVRKITKNLTKKSNKNGPNICIFSHFWSDLDSI